MPPVTCRVAYVVDLDELRVPRDVRASLTPNELFASLQEILLCAKGDEVPQPWSMLVAQNIVLSGEAGILTNLLARLALRCIIRDVVPELRVPVVQTTCSLVNDFQKNDESELACMMTFMMSHGRTSYGTPQVNNLIAAVTLTHNGLGHMLAHTIEVFTTFLTEDGAIDQYRLVIVPEMLKWAGAGADASGDAICYETNGRYDVFPMLCVGNESFTTIGFQTDGKTVKFKIMHKAPGEATADRTDPYGETGFMSIKWYYGFMVLRPERIGLIKTAAKL